MSLGPSQIPPQGARALVKAIVGAPGGRRSPDVTATLDEPEPGVVRLAFVNDGSGTAVDLRYVARGSDGALAHGTVGNLAPGADTSVRLAAAAEPFECVWRCEDAKGRVRVWSYAGRSSRVRGQGVSDEALFRSVYD